MNSFDSKELQHIIFLCFERKNSIGIEECEKDGTADLYRKCAQLLRDYDNE